IAEEFESLKENGTWELVPRPKDKEIIDTKWVFHLKHNVDRSIEKRKGRFVARDFTQIEGINYNETYSPVVSHSSLRTLIALATEYDLILHQMDVKNAYLNGELDVELYIEQPLFFEEKDREKYVCRLKKGLYGLKQVERIWNETLHNFLISKGYKALDSEPSIYIRRIGKNIVIIATYVDDLPILANNPVVLEEAKQELKDRFKIKDLGEAHHLLGLRIIKKEEIISIDQGHYTEKILKKYQIVDCNPIGIPLSKDLKLRTLRKDEEIVNEKEYKSVVGTS